jgi:hypothetical protein
MDLQCTSANLMPPAINSGQSLLKANPPGDRSRKPGVEPALNTGSVNAIVAQERGFVLEELGPSSAG